MIKQAIIPLAGLGTRLLPLTSVFAKELLPINGKPGLPFIGNSSLGKTLVSGSNLVPNPAKGIIACLII
jgi:UTP-glucose-1-phosphate uridylyltransferase